MENNVFISVIDAPQYGFYDTAGTYRRGASVPKTQTLAWVADYIRTQAAEQTAALRNIPRGETIPVTRKQRMHDGSFVDFTKDVERAKHYKATNFKRAYFGGVFNGGFKASNMVQPSHIFALDFDKIGTGAALEDARNKLMHDALVQPLLLFVSPSGDGLKMVFALPFDTPQAWRKRLAAVWYYMEKTHGLIADAACKDVNRGCYLPHDANVYFNPQARTTLDFDAWQPPQKPREQHAFTFNGEALAGDAERAAWYAEQLDTAHIDVTGTQQNWARLGLAIAELGEPGRGIFHTVSRAGFVDYDFYECDALFDYCLTNRTGGVGIATFIDAAKRAIGTTFEKEHKTHMENKTPSAKTQEFEPQPAQPQADAEQKQPREFDMMQTMFHTPTLEEIQHAFGHVPPAIPTGYIFGIGDEREELTLPNQALTVIAAQTSGGKTRMLQNIALRVAKYNTPDVQGETLFFSLEEPATDVLLEMANIAHNQRLTVNGKPGKNADILRNAIRSAYKRSIATDTNDTTPWLQFADAHTWEQEPQRTQQELDAANRVVGEFMANYLQPRSMENHDGKQPLLRIYGNEEFCKVQTMCKAVRKYQENGGRIKAIFVDYLGMFRTTNHDEMRLPKTERIELTLDALEWLAKDVNAPVIISAQLKREKDATPWTLRNSSVADSADVERSCNTMVLLWNSREPFNDTDEETNLRNAGFIAGQGGKLFARMTKRRGGIRNGAVVLNFAEDTGAITMGQGIARNGTAGEPATTPGGTTNQDLPF